MFEKDQEYVVIDSKVKIVDEQTGRIMEEEDIWWSSSSNRSKRKCENWRCLSNLCYNYVTKLL